MPQSASSDVNSPQTARDEVAETPVTKQRLEKVLLLQAACDRGCPCLILTQCVSVASSWDAAQPGYSKVQTDLFGVLPQLPAVLLRGNHARSARHAVLTLYNMLVVSPLCVKLASPDAAVAAAARAEALAAVLAATKSGLVKQLLGEATCATYAYTAICAQLHDRRLLPGYESEEEMKQELAGIMSDTQLTCCWVTALACILPGSMLAAPGAGSMAGEVLQLCGRYFGYLQAVQQHDNQTPAARQRQQQQEQQLGLMQLPADDVTAAVVHTASLLLQDLGRHMQQRDRQQLQELHPLQQQQQRRQQQHKQPDAVQELLSERGNLLHIAVPLAVIFGDQLRLHLQHELQHQRQQQHQQQQELLGFNPKP